MTVYRKKPPFLKRNSWAKITRIPRITETNSIEKIYWLRRAHSRQSEYWDRGRKSSTKSPGPQTVHHDLPTEPKEVKKNNKTTRIETLRFKNILTWKKTSVPFRTIFASYLTYGISKSDRVCSLSWNIVLFHGQFFGCPDHVQFISSSKRLGVAIACSWITDDWVCWNYNDSWRTLFEPAGKMNAEHC